jgi:hypothetical protein
MTRDAKDDKMNVMRFLMRNVDERGWDFSRKERAAIKWRERKNLEDNGRGEI